MGGKGFLYGKLAAWIYAIDNSPVLSSIRKGFILTIPAVMAGCTALLILNLPLPGFHQILVSFGGGILNRLLLFIYNSTIEFMSVYLVLSISFYYSGTLAPNNSIMQILAMINGLICFIASFGGSGGSLTLSSFGTIGVFTAMVCAIFATGLFFATGFWFFKKSHFYAPGADFHYRSAVSAIGPILVCTLVFSLMNVLLNGLFHTGDFNELISRILAELFGYMNSRLANGLLYTVMVSLLWVFGIHAGNALEPVAKTVFAEGASDQAVMITKSFLDNFTVPGGSGATLCLVLALIIAGRSKDNKQLAYSVAPMTLFNINEMLIFGLPIVLNPVMLLPFVLVPAVALLIAYGAAAAGFIKVLDNGVAWTTPTIFSGYLLTGSWRGSLVQLLILAAGTAIYLPFVRFSDNLRQRQAAYLLRGLTERFKKEEKAGYSGPYLSRSDDFGNIAKNMVSQLRQDIREQNIPIMYQPLVAMDDNQVVGAEALLRWSFGGEKVYPPLIIALAKEDNCYSLLTKLILEEAAAAACRLAEELNPAFRISVNVSAEQLNDPVFIKESIELVERRGVRGNISLEMTEETGLGEFSLISRHIDMLREQGITVSIDDFSMGQTSLDYLRNNLFSLVKLDGGLVNQAKDNIRCRRIISSISALGRSLDFQVLAECVETEELKELMAELGCRYFQGFLISPAVPLEELTLIYEKSKGE